MKIKTNYDGCPYITAGKEYPVVGAVILADEGRVIDLDDVMDIDWQVVSDGRFSQEVAQEMYDLLEECTIMLRTGTQEHAEECAVRVERLIAKMEKNDE